MAHAAAQDPATSPKHALSQALPRRSHNRTARYSTATKRLTATDHARRAQRNPPPLGNLFGKHEKPTPLILPDIGEEGKLCQLAFDQVLLRNLILGLA